MRTLRLVVVAGFLASALSVAHVNAGGPPTGGGCPTGSDWELRTVADILSITGLPAAPASMDHNEDGWTCVRFHELANGNKGWTAIVFRDNRLQD